MKDVIKKLPQPFLHGMPEVDVPKDRQDNVEHVRSWLDFQPHLPPLTDEHIHLFLHACYDNLEKTKQIIESRFTFRTLTPELFSQRHILGQYLQGIMKICELVVVPQHTDEGYDVALFRFVDYDASKFVYMDGLKAIFVAIDFYISKFGLSKGVVIVFDIKGLSLGHLARIHPISMIKKPFFYIQECMALRLQGVHLINTGTVVEKLMAMIKPFIQSELAQKMYIHATVDTLSEHMSLDILPEEYGGKAGPITNLFNELKRELFTDDYVHWFDQEEQLRNDESRRVGKSAVKETLFGVEGSFRKLEID